MTTLLMKKKFIKKKIEENKIIYSENSYTFKLQICNIIIHINKKELFLPMHVYLVSTSLKKKKNYSE